MKLRKIIFWLHLTAGVVAGAVILVMSVTGVLLAFERQIVAFAERDTRTVTPPASDAPRLSLDSLVAKAREAVPAGTPSGVTLAADPTAATVVNFGREQTVFVDPYTGTVRDNGVTATRDFFRVVTDWHRWLGTDDDSREVGRAADGRLQCRFYGVGHEWLLPLVAAPVDARGAERRHHPESDPAGQAARLELA